VTEHNPNMLTEEEGSDEAFFFPASFAQQRLWTVDQLMPGTAMYNMPLALRLTGPLDVEVLQDAIEEIMWRHETLRTTFDVEDGQLMQVVAPDFTYSLTVIDLAGLPAESREAEMRRLTQEEVGRPFDLATGPLLRTQLIRLHEREHVLIANMHHIITDGWSLGIFSSELFTLYAAFARGEESPLEELPIQYADFSVWQRDYLAGDVLDRQLDYWKQQLGDDFSVLPLPIDRPRPPMQTQNGSVEGFKLSPELSLGLQELAKKHGASLFMLLLGAFQTLLYRYTGQEAISVGTPSAGRDQSELQPMIGFFINTLVMRTDLSGEPTFADVIQRAKETALGAYANQDIPFEKLVEELAPERDMSITPLFQVMFALQNMPAPRGEEEESELQVAPVDFDANVAKFDITLQMLEGPQGIVGSFEYNTDLFDATTIRRMGEHFTTLLTSILANPATPIHRLPLLPPAERTQLVEGWNQTAVDYPQDITLHSLFEQQVERTPDAPALLFEEQVLTYRELNARANQLAHYLQQQGVGPDQMVGVAMERSVEMVVALYGILKAGGSYLPIDPTHPADRIQFTIEDSTVGLLLTQAHLLDSLPAHSATTLCLDTEWEQVAGESTANPPCLAQATNLAYTIYTSGSTGKPKGAMNEHRGIVNRLLWMQDEYQLTAQDTVLQKTPFSFDVSVWEFFWPLFTGARLVVAKPEGHKDSGYLVDLIERHQITTLHFVPSMLQVFLNEERLDKCASIRQVMASGEALPYELAERFFQKLPHAELHNLYGPTEAAVDVTYWDCRRSRELGFVPIGRPVANTQLYILDKWLQPVPIGVSGELHIAGIQVARGYWNREEMSAEKFIANPFGAGRLYKTGDVARYLPDGTIQYMGRIDFQVKIRGFRIELGEIEEVVASHENVREACVLVKDDHLGNKRVVAYAVPHAGELDSKAVRRYVRELLPEYMVPSLVIAVSAMPLSPNGKVDRRALPEPDFTKPELDGSYEAPRTETEQILAEIWASVLRVEQVGIHDNFFELGGDSILSIQIVQRAAQRGLKLTPKDMFKYQNIAELADVAATATPITAEQGLVTGDVPLTPIQHWFLAQDFTDAHHWNFPLLLDVREALDLSALQAALGALLAHHDALRLHLVPDAEPLQLVNADQPAELPFVVIDLANRDAEEQDAAYREEVDALQASLALTGPLVRFAYFDLGPERPHRLFFAMHHLVADGVSVRILLEDLETAYQQAVQGQPIQLPPKTTSFRDWSEKLTAYATSEAARVELPYWQAVAERAVTPLPLDRPAGANTSASREQIVVGLEADETKRLLQDVPRAYNTQINDILLAALAEAFANWTGSRELLVTMEGHGREEIVDGVDLSRTVGWFTSMYPVRLDLAGVAPLGQTLKAVKEQLRAIPQRGIGYGILRYLAAELPQAQEPQVMFNYLGQFGGATGESGEQPLFANSMAARGHDHSARNQRSFVLDVNGLVQGGHLLMSFGYSHELHDEATISALAHSFIEALRALIAHCTSEEAGGYTPSDFPQARLTQSELDTFLDRFSADEQQNLEQIYQLSPTQEGMLFHTMLAPGTGVYVVQLSLEVTGALDSATMQRAWSQVLQRHSVLRTSFHWTGLANPLQTVYKQVEMPIIELDWTGTAPEEQATALADFLRADTLQGFDLARSPLMRLTLIRTGDNVHRVVWTVHHLILDGWSMPIVFGEAFSLYETLVAGQTLPLRPSRPYQDYIAWLQAQDEAAAERFWRTRMAGFSTPTALRVEKLRREVGAGEKLFATAKGALDGERTARLQELARQNGLTLNTFVQGAWALLLSRYSGDTDVTFGATVSGRPADLDGAENMVGLFINTLPQRVQLDPEQSVVTFLQQLQQEQVDVRDFEYTPLVKVHEWSGAARDRELFDTIVVFENYPMDDAVADASAAEGTLTITDFATGEATNYPLSLAVSPGRTLSFTLSYDRRVFDDETVARLQDHLLTALHGMIAAPEQKLGDVSLVSQEEAQQLAAWNETAVAHPQGVTLHQLFEAQAARTPDQIAVIAGEGTLTYRELDEQANRLARHLRDLGVGPDDRVGLCLERSLAMVVGLYAILKAGGAYVPLDPSYPQERLAYMVDDAQARVLLTSTHLRDRLQLSAEHVLCLDALPETVQAQDSTALVPLANEEHLAYIIYTSGSTGKPKGVMIPHAAICNHMFWMQRVYQFGAADVILQKTPFSFDASVWEFHAPLLAGGRLAMASPSWQQNFAVLVEEIKRYDVTVLQLVPSLLYALLAEHDLASCTTLRHVFCGGEALTSELAKRFHESMSADLHNLYGPTEATIDATWHDLSREDNGLIPIGRPVDNATMYILDEHLQPVPIGVPGELHIGGRGLARGYLDRPELTEEKFIANPFGAGRLYKTGDLARFQPDGTLHYLGRIDFQVKLRGFRIELGEIEEALLAQPTVREAAVLVREDLPGQQRLVAYLVPQAGELDAVALRAALKADLPEYMVPAAYVTLDRLPLSPSGKVDRRALPVPDEAGYIRESAYVAPRDAFEKQLAAIWAQLLGVEQVGIRDNFFDLGGHSLIAVRMIGEISRRLGMSLPLASLYEGGTVEAMAHLLRAEADQSNHPCLVPIRTAGEGTPLFLVHPAGGGVGGFVPLANELPAQPLYGLQSPGLRAGEDCLATVEEMASTYVEAIRTVQDAGPYQLGGWSLGGAIAYEMARQLLAAGEQVALLALLDTPNPDLSREVEEAVDRETRIRIFTEEMARVFEIDMSGLTEAEMATSETLLEALLDRAERQGFFERTGTDKGDARRMMSVQANNTAAIEAYRPQPLDLAVTLFRAQDEQQPFRHDHPLLGWERLASEVRVYDVPGTHNDLVEPQHAPLLARALQQALATH